jgi:hypothetical protein
MYMHTNLHSDTDIYMCVFLDMDTDADTPELKSMVN